ncbi:nitroreductase family protein [Mycobacterium sp.]|uniref:nitroreductase family protein n=1 Tax=Mycobacterium sp. TaxID=1785 RepID=UPI003C713949
MADKAQRDRDLQLPAPASDPDDPIVAMFDRRKTTRDIDPAPLPMQELSNLLWSAFGVNRKVGPFGVPGRTAGSASNSQEIDLYVALADGAYRYDAPNCRLELVTHSDLRASALTPGQQGITVTAPVQLIYVVDLHRLTHTMGFEEPGLHDPEIQKSYYYVDTGLIAENVYLFAAAYGLAAWFHNCDRASLAQSLELKAEQRVLFAQSVGHPSAH